MNYNPLINHRKSIRLKDYDYSQKELYFITICCAERKCLFGEIANEKMNWNNAGKIAAECWLQIPTHFPNVTLHEYIVMPNHLHGIVELKENPTAVGVENFQPLHQQPALVNKFQKIIPYSIGSIVKGFKIGVTKWFRANTDVYTVWQRNYYEHIIRNNSSYETISAYIVNNPSRWNEDKFYTTNISIQ